MTKAERAAKIKSVEQEIKDAKQQAADLEKKSKTLAEQLVLIKAGGATVEKVEQLLNDDDWKAHCDSRTCVVAFLPHIFDDGKKGRDDHTRFLAMPWRLARRTARTWASCGVR